MPTYLRREQDRKAAILSDAPDTKFRFESQDPYDVPEFRTKNVENFYQWNDEAGHVVRENRDLIDAMAARYGVDPDVVKAIIYTEVARGGYGYKVEAVDRYLPRKFEMTKTRLPANISPDWQELIPGSDVRNPRDNIELGTKLISGIAKRLDDPSIENIYSLYNSLSHDRTYVNNKTKTTPYFAKMALEARAWEKDGWHSPEFPQYSAPGAFPKERFGEWGSSPAGAMPATPADTADSFDGRFGNWGSSRAGSFGGNSPVLRELRRYRQSALPRDPQWNSPDGGGPTGTVDGVPPAPYAEFPNSGKPYSEQAFTGAAPEIRYVSSEQQDSPVNAFSRRLASRAVAGPANTTQPASPPLLGLVSGQPMQELRIPWLFGLD